MLFESVEIVLFQHFISVLEGDFKGNSMPSAGHVSPSISRQQNQLI